MGKKAHLVHWGEKRLLKNKLEELDAS